MAKGKKGGKGRRQHGDDDSDNNSDDEKATTEADSSSKMSFAERRQFQRQQAADKRRSKMNCHLCGKEGHVRRECPGFEDDGKGESKYKNANGDRGAQMNTKKGGSKNRGRKNDTSAGSSSAEGSSSFGVELPPGFGVIAAVRQHGEDTTVEQEEAVTEEGPFVYYDASCDVDAILDYYRTGRSKHKKSIQEAIHDCSQQPPSSGVTFGGCISRGTLKPNRPWKLSAQGEQLANALVKVHPIWYVIGLSHDFCCLPQTTTGAVDDPETSNETAMTAATQALLETITASNTNMDVDNNSQEETASKIVGLFADLDYSPYVVSRSGCDRPAQLQRLRATLAAAAHQSNNNHTRTVQIRVSPAAPTTATDSGSGGSDEEHPYDQAMADLMIVLKEFLPNHANLKVHLSCWTGTPAHMNQLLQEYSNSSQRRQVWIGMDATVTFSKAPLSHECAFDIHPTHNLVLETGRPGTIPSTITRALGRDAFGHAAYSIPWIAHGVAAQQPQHTTKSSAQAIARAASANVTVMYPGILQGRRSLLEGTD